MEYGDPSAPLTQYQDLYPAPAIKQPNGALCVWAVNDSCVGCRKEISQEKPGHLVILECKHAYHLDCVRTYLQKNGMECLKCFDEGNKMTSKAREFAMAPEKDEDANDEENKKAEIEEHYADIHGDSILAKDQKVQLIGVKYSITHPKEFLRTKIGMDFLLENDKNLDDLYDAGLGLLDIYFTLEINAWSELVRLGVNHEHLLLTQGGKPFLPLNQLVDLYEVIFPNLMDIGLTMNRASTYGFYAKELIALDMTFDKLTDYGMRKSHMFNYENINFSGWRALGFTKDHLIEFQFKYADFDKLRWNFPQVAYKFNLNQIEKDFILQGAKLKKPRKTKTSAGKKRSNRNG